MKSATPSRSAPDTMMIGTTTIRVRINVMHGCIERRIYLSLPAQQPGPITASWVTRTILAGAGAPGSRAVLRSHLNALHGRRTEVPVHVDGTLIRRPSR